MPDPAHALLPVHPAAGCLAGRALPVRVRLHPALAAHPQDEEAGIAARGVQEVQCGPKTISLALSVPKYFLVLMC